MTDPLAAMKAKFVLRCAEDLAVLQRGEDTPAFRGVIHRLAGAAGMFGYADLGSLALELDKQGQDSDAFPLGALDTLMRALEAVAAKAGNWPMERRA